MHFNNSEGGVKSEKMFTFEAINRKILYNSSVIFEQA